MSTPLFQQYLPAVVFAMAALTVGCAHPSSNATTASDTTTASTTTASDSTTANATTDAPVYPGAQLEAAGSNAGVGSAAASGKAYTTGDSFDAVYDWYKKNLPAGSEQSHVTSPMNAAVFVLGNAGDRYGITVETSPMSGKTMIVIGHVKA